MTAILFLLNMSLFIFGIFYILEMIFGSINIVVAIIITVISALINISLMTYVDEEIRKW